MALVELVPHLALASRPRPKKTQRLLPSARPRAQHVYVPSPTVPGHRDRVERVVDTIDSMFRRKQLTERQHRTAEIYRGAWDMIHSSVGGSMDFDRVRGGDGLPGKPLAMRYMDACEHLSDAKLKLYTRDREVLELIARDGHSQADTADIIHGGSATRAEREEVGRRLHSGLDELADLWLGPLRRKESGHIVAQRDFEQSEFELKTGELQRTGGVAHATRSGVKMRKP